VATIDHTPYTLVPDAVKFREELGGEEAIRKYCWDVARRGGQRVAEILGTQVMDNKTRTLSQCCFANVRLPLNFKLDGDEEVEGLSTKNAGEIKSWLNSTALDEFDTYLPTALHGESMWVRLSAQIYLGLEEFEWVGNRLKELCDRLLEKPELIHLM